MTLGPQNPRFPRELERLIFLEAANASVYTARTLVLVSKRVQSWVEPMIYRTIMIDEDLHWPPLKRLAHPVNSTTVLSLLEKHGRHVQHLLVRDINHPKPFSTKYLIKWLRLCPHIIDLAVWSRVIEGGLMQAAGKLKLKKFSGGFKGFEHYTFSPGATVGVSEMEEGDEEDMSEDGNDDEDEPHTIIAAAKTPSARADLSAWFHTLTHLDLTIDDLEPNKHFRSFLHNLPSLTHLSMNYELQERDWDDVKAAVLEECKSLQAAPSVVHMSILFEEEQDYGDFDDDGGVNPATAHLRGDFKLCGDPLTLESRMLSHPTAHPAEWSLYAKEDPRLITMFSKFSEDWLKTALSYDLGRGSGDAKDLWDTAVEAVEKERVRQAKEKVLRGKREEALAGAKAKMAAIRVQKPNPAPKTASTPAAPSTNTPARNSVTVAANTNGNGGGKKRKKKVKKGKNVTEPTSAAT